MHGAVDDMSSVFPVIGCPYTVNAEPNRVDLLCSQPAVHQLSMRVTAKSKRAAANWHAPAVHDKIGLKLWIQPSDFFD